MIYINKQKFSESINSVNNEIDSMTHIVNTFNNTALDTQTEWKGRSGEVFEAFNKDLAIDLKKVHFDLESISLDLQAIVQEFETVDEELASKIGK